MVVLPRDPTSTGVQYTHVPGVQRQSRRGRPCGRGHIHSSPSTHDRNTRKITFLCTVSTTANKKTFTERPLQSMCKNGLIMNILVLMSFQLIAVTACSFISSDNDNLLNVYARHFTVSVSAYPWEPQPDLARLIGFIPLLFRKITFGDECAGFCGPRAFPDTEPTASKHWGKVKTLTTTTILASSFFHPPQDLAGSNASVQHHGSLQCSSCYRTQSTSKQAETKQSYTSDFVLGSALISHFDYTTVLRPINHVPYDALWANMTSFTKPEVHNILHCRRRKTEPRP